MNYKTLNNVQEVIQSSPYNIYGTVYMDKGQVTVLLDVEEEEFPTIVKKIEKLLTENDIFDMIVFDRLKYSEYRRKG